MNNKYQKFQKKNTGFTLIELLVVIALIGILSTIAYVTFQGTQKRGRDRQRMSDLTQLSTALQLYYGKHGFYPPNNVTPERKCDSSRGSTPNGGLACPIGSGSNWDLTSSDLKPLLDEGLITKLPVDPINSTTYYYKFEPYTRRDNAAQCSNFDASTQNDYGCGFYLATKLENDGTIYCILVGSTAGTCGASL